MKTLQPDQQRRFAVEAVQTLRAAGFEAYWAGGCVRDQLLGKTSKDYDVATNAMPDQIRATFGRRRTRAVGAAFGVILVQGPDGAGQIEVATFRRDSAYSDGRHPDHVTFCTAEQDAARRDFTINGLFFDPVADRVIDFVGGREDLAGHLLRAVGNPEERFAEDKLRLLRAVRFAARFELNIEPRTWAAIRQMAPEIRIVSPERIAEEMRSMLIDRHRAEAARLLVETGLAVAILPEIVPHDAPSHARLRDALEMLRQIDNPGFPLSLASLLYRCVTAETAEQICRRWRLSNRETDRVTWLVGHHAALQGARSMPWSRLQPILIAEGIDDLLAMNEAAARTGSGDLEDVLWCRERRMQPPEMLNPPPLVTGDDLVLHGVRPGPKYRELLDRVREAQLDGRIGTRDEALAWADRIQAETE
ncbi:MAG: CCA tRNA nucleotidyltransferase [Thermoguttaceae bacterium]